MTLINKKSSEPSELETLLEAIENGGVDSSVIIVSDDSSNLEMTAFETVILEELNRGVFPFTDDLKVKGRVKKLFKNNSTIQNETLVNLPLDVEVNPKKFRSESIREVELLLTIVDSRFTILAYEDQDTQEFMFDRFEECK